jgi:hypothetical protein
LNFSLAAGDGDVREGFGVRREWRFVDVLTFRGAILETNAADEATDVSPKSSEILELTSLRPKDSAGKAAKPTSRRSLLLPKSSQLKSRQTSIRIGELRSPDASFR